MEQTSEEKAYKRGKQDMREPINAALGRLNSTLLEQLIDTKLITIAQWNEEIAPKLSELCMAIEGTTITARTYRLPENYFEPNE